ncbi:MAG: GNAT family N-acetyltransferase [Ferruginibacter sp.]|nr:GNAT family N-acetyltransferase [Ferruginibacter sp.]
MKPVTQTTLPINQIEIRLLSKGDTKAFVDLLHIFKDAFEMNDRAIPGEEYLNTLLSKKDFLVFAALQNNTVVAGLTIYVQLQYFSTQPVAFIYDIAVEKSYQGNGTGSRLLETVLEFCRANGFDEAFVEADATDIDAVSFYRKTKYTSVVNTLQFTYSINEIIPG